jgi:hypothetical protein
MKAKTFFQFINESSDERTKARLIELGLAPDPKALTLGEFKKVLKAEYKEYMDSVKHEDDYMGIWDFYSENADIYKREYGIFRNDDGELEYNWDNKNYSEDDEDDEDYY